MVKKIRLDDALLMLYPDLKSKTYVQSLIMQGKVYVDDQVVTKSGYQVADSAKIYVEDVKKEYVCRAGYKLARALDIFDIKVEGLIALDAGLSTGGFTDCLLQRGIERVYGVDVGYGQVDFAIRQNKRVVVMERTNLRYLADLPELIDIATLDLSFISVLKVVDAVKLLLKPHARLVILIKPQFEAERHEVGRGGIVNDDAVHERVVKKICEGMTEKGFSCKGVIESPLRGATGNKEFLGYFVS